MKKWIIAISCLALLAGCSPKKQVEKAPEGKLTILWAKWAPADYLQELSKDFTAETGIEVEVKQARWDDFYDTFFDSVEAKSNEYDMVGGDSQWLGRGVADRIYVDLTVWMKEREVDQLMTEASITGYSEFPKGSGRYWAVPLMGDAMGFAYRRDLFEDPKEKEAFQKEYGYPLDIPKTWAQLRDIAEFFHRPEKDFYGANIWASAEYDAITMGFESLIWAYGGDLGDQTTFKVRGILNAPQSAEAIELYKEIHSLGAPEWRTAYLDANEAFIQGKVAMVMSYFAFFPDLLDPDQNPYAKQTGFFANPAGPVARVSSLGGQGLSVLSSSKNKRAALKFLEWFIQPDVQWKWAQLGGYSCSRSVLDSPEFLSKTPYNKALKESMTMMQDFWVVPEYPELLAISQKYWAQFLHTDTLTAQQANDIIAQEWEEIFELAGYYKE